MKTAILSLIGIILALLYVIFLSPVTWLSLVILPLAWIIAVWMMHGLSRAYTVALCVGIALDLHYFNFGLITLLLLVSLSVVYFISITVISSTNAASTMVLAWIFPTLIYGLLWLSLGLVNGFRYYAFSFGSFFIGVASALTLALLAYSYCLIVRQLSK